MSINDENRQERPVDKERGPDTRSRFSLQKVDEFSREHGRAFLFLCVGVLVFSGLLSTAVFFLSVRGPEQVLVPEVTGKELTSALLELQAKELYPQIQLRYSGSAAEKGLILEQDPQPGTIVKAGRRIRLVINQGVRLSVVENVVGRTLNDVRIEIAQSAASGFGLITLKEPFLYKTSDAPAGTILEQSPQAGTSLGGPTELTLVVSRGPDSGMKEMPSVIGLSPSEAASRLAEREIGFVFTTKEAAEDEKWFVVNAQDWPGGTQIAANQTVNIQVTLPASWNGGEICSLYSYRLPQTPVPISYTLTAISPQGERTVLITEVLSGGAFTYPYLLPIGTTLSLGVQGRELHREIIEAP
ncbi:MAG: PASTA domain-containing protein [Spirochaetaceae bacterium]|jgi:beta-lactam-binding protein with PASTA domain|nr:PASTA domain-containing protein [Spirochaetaceae bacterium]